ncbi:ATP/GTP-binding protein [Streptomyces sp. NRAIS4]
MSDESDDAGGGTLVRGPWSGDSTYTLPPIPDFIDTIPPPEDIPEAPPESPEETTMELPPIPAAPDPAMALRSDGISPPDSDDEADIELEGEYVQPRSLADRLGDWLEFRLEMARANHKGEAPFREAEIARKAALLEGRTAQEVAMMEQNGKLHAAMMKAKGDKAAARGKADADRAKSSASGLGADKGRSKAGGGGGSSRGGGGSGPFRNNSSSGPNRSGGSRGSNSGGPGGRSGSGTTGGGGGGKGGAKGSDRSSGGRAAGSGRSGSSGGSKGSQTGSGGSGRNSGGSLRGDGGGPSSSARAERARGRQERAGVRQAGRQERRSAGHAAGVADRSKDRDQARAQRQQAWEDRRAKRQERGAARKAKREAAASAVPGRTTLGQAVGEEAQRRWDKRRADTKAAKDAKAGTEKVSLTKDKDKSTDGKGGKTAKDGPDGSSSAARDGTVGDAPGTESTAGDGASDGARKRRRFWRRRTGGTGRAGRRGRARRTGRTGRTGRGRTGRAGRRGRESDSPFGAEDSTPTVEWLDRPTRPPRTDGEREDEIEDAVIVLFPDDPAAVTTGVKGLPPAPEQHTKRPGTSRPTSEGSSVSSTEVSRPSGQSGLAAQHRTNITFDEYLVEVANIAVATGVDKDQAESLADAVGKVADALRDMAADLVDDHNIDPRVTTLILDLADAATRMKLQAERCAVECGIAYEAATLAGLSVARVYGEDMKAMDDAGLSVASAATHHD